MCCSPVGLLVPILPSWDTCPVESNSALPATDDKRRRSRMRGNDENATSKQPSARVAIAALAVGRAQPSLIWAPACRLPVGSVKSVRVEEALLGSVSDVAVVMAGWVG